MTVRVSTLITAGLLGAMLLVGSLNPVLAGDGCPKDKGEGSTSGITTPAVPADERIG
jgi:hypothetical protein